jgi:hypothetical protein
VRAAQAGGHVGGDQHRVDHVQGGAFEADQAEGVAAVGVRRGGAVTGGDSLDLHLPAEQVGEVVALAGSAAEREVGQCLGVPS